MVCLLRCSVYAGLFAVGIWAFYKTFCTTDVPTTIYGSVDQDFERVRQKFDALLKDGWIQGAQFAVYYKDKLVVDLAGGYADEHARRPLKTDNYVVTFSTIKSIFSLLTAIVIEKAGVDFEDRVSKYWTEFAQNGKENVTIANLLLHQGGVCGLDEKFSLQDSDSNSQHYQNVLAKQKPLTPINERPYYHSMTYGLYLDQLMRHIDSKKRGARQLLLEELSEQCGAFDIRMGVPPAEFYRAAKYYPPGLKTIFDSETLLGVIVTLVMWLKVQVSTKVSLPDGSTLELAAEKLAGFMSDFQEFEQFGNPEVSSKFGLAATGSWSTARDLARAYHIVTNGGYCTKVAADGSTKRVRVLSSETMDKITTKRYSGPPVILPFDEERNLFGWIFPSPLNTTVTGSPGFGGQQAFADQELGVSFTYLTNYLKPASKRDRAFMQLLDVTYQVISELQSEAKKAS